MRREPAPSLVFANVIMLNGLPAPPSPSNPGESPVGVPMAPAQVSVAMPFAPPYIFCYKEVHGCHAGPKGKLECLNREDANLTSHVFLQWRCYGLCP
jgi:hypothetical protein